MSITTIEDALAAAGVTATTLSPAHGDRLDRDGFVVIEDALAPAELAQARRGYDDAAARQGADRATGTQHVVLDDALAQAWLPLIVHPAPLAAAWRVIGRPFRAGLHGRDPRPGFGQQGLHGDAAPRGPHEPFHVVTCLWMLDDFTADNGAPRVVPGSHRWAHALPKTALQPEAHHRDERVVVGPAGAVLIFNGHLLHSGRRNASARRRRAVQHVLVAEAPHPAGEVPGLRPGEVSGLPPLASYLLGQDAVP